MFAWGLILNLVRHLTRKVRMQLRDNIGSGTGKNKIINSNGGSA
jgi:hypothetical protein